MAAHGSDNRLAAVYAYTDTERRFKFKIQSLNGFLQFGQHRRGSTRRIPTARLQAITCAIARVPTTSKIAVVISVLF